MLLLDTDFLIDFTKGEKPAVEFLGAMLEKRERLFISSVSCAELFHGAFRFGEESAIAELSGFLASFDIIGFGLAESRIAGELMSSLSKKGQWCGGFDALNAAIALTHHQAIVTRNTKHYSRFKGLRIQKW